MANSVFYCEVAANDTREFQPGVYMIPDKKEYKTKISRCCSYSANVWIQGPKGGVRYVREWGVPRTGYINKNINKMKYFMWAKLKAQPLKNYT